MKLSRVEACYLIDLLTLSLFEKIDLWPQNFNSKKVSFYVLLLRMLAWNMKDKEQFFLEWSVRHSVVQFVASGSWLVSS